MTPDDVSTVQRSWAELRRRRIMLVSELSRCLVDMDDSTIEPVIRAGWLCATIEELVGLLSSPTSLAERACEMGRSFPDPLTAPSFVVDGRAWLRAASSCACGWSDHTETAWRKAWLLLSDALAEETLSPFSDGWHPGRSPRR
jgi:hypothetical protein